jgi:Tol biopolymer transport system component
MRTSISSRPALDRLRLLAPIAVTALVSATFVGIQAPADAARAGHTDRGQHRAAAADNGRIAFVRAGRIFTVNAFGGDLTRLTARDGNLRPHYSPDGSRISFIRRTGGNWDVWVMKADGSGKQQVTHVGDVTEAQWSPDGKWLAFGPTLSKIRSTAPFGDPVTILGDMGDGPEELLVDSSLAWSPDGNQIAYYSHQFPDSPDNFLLVLDLTTGNVIEWNAVGGSCCGEGFFGNPAWSPDSGQLAYEALLFFPEDGEHRTRPYIQMDNFPSGTGAGYPKDLGNKDPEFSPDGAQLLVSHVIRGRLSIQVTDIDGSNRHRIVARAYQPDWQPVIGGTRHRP